MKSPSEVTAPGGALTGLAVTLVQGDSTTPIFELTPATAAELTTAGDEVSLARPAGKRVLPDLKAGEAQVNVTAVRPVLFGLRQATSTETRTLEVRLTPPQLAVLSQFHYINHGGSEMVVYRVTPPDAESGVRVGDREYRGFPAGGTDPALRLAFFALLWDQDLKTPITVFARDAVGNEGSGSFDFRVFPKQFRVEHDQPRRPVPRARRAADPAELHRAQGRRPQQLPGVVPRDQPRAAPHEQRDDHGPRARNGTRDPLAQARSSSSSTRPSKRGSPISAPTSTTATTSITRCISASISHRRPRRPVHAANRGRVLHAGWLGIYGNCVILDHGMGLQSLYAHLSSISVSAGQVVESEAELGRSGSTGLAGGDHLHFTMLLGGNAITPIDWWSAQWVQDRVLRKLTDAGLTPPAH